MWLYLFDILVRYALVSLWFFLPLGGGIPQSPVLAYPGTPFVISGGRSPGIPGTPHPPGHIQLLPRPSGTLSPSTPHMLSPTAGNPNINASKFFFKNDRD